VNELVLDASVVLKWFASPPEQNTATARRVRAEYEAGRLAVVIPSLLYLELVNVAGRRWGWGETPLLGLAAALGELAFEAREPELSAVAAWTARGLTAYDAAYVALAEQWSLTLLTDDQQILAVAPQVAKPLASWEPGPRREG